MIFTVYCAWAEPALHWRAELLEYSWRRIRQPGELIRLVPLAPAAAPRRSRIGRSVETLGWNPHPFTGDRYAGYATPGAVLEWLFRERVDGTILLLDPTSVFRRPVTEEVSPGRVLATPWPEMPLGNGGPFGLQGSLKFLERYCVNRDLPLAAVRPPLLAHARDLRRLAARWLELTSIIRSDGKHPDALRHADRLAFAIAAAEYRTRVDPADLGADTGDTSCGTPIIDYRVPVESSRGDIVWDPEVYTPWAPVFPEQACPGSGRELLELLQELVTRHQSGTDMALTRPRRCAGVREARVLDEMHLEVPGRQENVVLNPSAAAIWELCDDHRTLLEIVDALQAQFEAPAEALRLDVERTAHELEDSGVLELESLSG